MPDREIVIRGDVFIGTARNSRIGERYTVDPRVLPLACASVRLVERETCIFNYGR